MCIYLYSKYVSHFEVYFFCLAIFSGTFKLILGFKDEDVVSPVSFS